MQLQFSFTGFEQQLKLKSAPFVARIYDGDGETPEGFNVRCISLDATDRSLLNWKKAILDATRAREAGIYILWELEFGILNHSLSDETQFLALQLNVKHFNDAIWKTFRDCTFGVALFRGELREEILDYLKALAALLSDEISCFLFLDAVRLQSCAEYFQVIDLEALGLFHPILKGHFAERYPWAIPALAWGHCFSPLGFCSDKILPTLKQKKINYGLCLPKNANWDEIQRVFYHLGSIPFRVIPENLLTQEWDGLDKLIIFPQQLSAQCSRKILGFLAAGGEVIKFPDDAALLPLQEISPPLFPCFFAINCLIIFFASSFPSWTPS